MTINNITIRNLVLAALLMSHGSGWSMETSNAATNMLLVLPNEILRQSLSDINPLKDGIKTALSLRRTCKHFYALPLEHFAKAYQHHTKAEKNEVLKKVFWNMLGKNYWNIRNGALILIHAGADNNADRHYPLLRKAIYRNDTNMIAILFENGANPNQKILGEPNFYDIKTIEIAKIFTANKVNWNTEGSPLKPNVLWYNILYNPSSDLISFYLSHYVNAKKIGLAGDCLLHCLASHPAYTMHNINDYVKIGALLLKAAPEMVDVLNNNNETPIDVARKKMKGRDANHPICIANEQLITLFEKQKLINTIKNFYPTNLSRE